MHSNEKNLRWIYIGGAMLFVLVSVVIYLAVTRTGQKGQVANSTNTYYDPRSKETVSDPAGKTPENYGVNPDQPIYLGFSRLITVGVTKYQVSATESALYQYSKLSKKNAKEVSITVDSVTVAAADPKNPNIQTVLFDVTFDRTTTYKARLECFDLTSVKLHLLDAKTGSPVYDSEVVDTSTGE
jgi:hypothetical protein